MIYSVLSRRLFRPFFAVSSSLQQQLQLSRRLINTGRHLRANEEKPSANDSNGFRVISSTSKTTDEKQRPTKEGEKTIEVTFVLDSGERITAKGRHGDSLLDVVVDNDLDIDGFGACEGTLACSTCHLIFPQDVYDKIPNKPLDEELDMLDLAFDLTDTSRLGCQIYLTKDLNGLEVKVPDTINDQRLT